MENSYISIDQVLINRLTEIIHSHLDDEKFGVEELAKEAGINRSHLHRRVKKITGKSASHFLHLVRLEKAMEMLQHDEATVSEIAFRVGFSSPAYFNRCFHDQYGFPPGEARKRELINPGTTQEETSQKETNEMPHGGILSYLIQKWIHLRNRFILLTGIVIFILLSLIFYNLYTASQKNAKNIAVAEKSIMVTPFRNFSNDVENQYFADGIMEDILNNLFHITDLRVISRTTSERFRDVRLTTQEIARQSNARNVLEGSVRRFGDKIRISVQLIDAYGDRHLWSENFDRELSDIMGVQSEIAMQVAKMLNVVLSDNEINRIRDIPTRNAQAYDYYLRARFLLHKANSPQRADFDREGVMNCIQYYEKAIAADSVFAEAWAGLANAWFNLSAWGFLPMDQGFPKARDLSVRALEIDPDCAEAHAVLGAYYVWPAHNFKEGGKELELSVHLNPNFSTARQWYAQYLMITGPIEEARLQIDRALELEPNFWVTENLNSWIYYFEEKYEKAIEACISARDLKPGFSDNNWLIFLNYVKLNEGVKAAEALQNIARLYTGPVHYNEEVMVAYRKAGIPGLFSWLIDVNQNRPVPLEGMNGHPFFIAWWNAINGNKEESIKWLEKNADNPRPLYHYFNLIATNPDFDILRDDPRFLAVINKTGLAPYHKRKVRK